MGVIKWQELSDKRSNQLLNRAAKLRAMPDEEIEKEYQRVKNKLRKTSDKKERQPLMEDLELIYDEKKFRAQDKAEGRQNPWIKEESKTKNSQENSNNQGERKEERKTSEQKQQSRIFSAFLQLLKPEPLPPLWRK